MPPARHIRSTTKQGPTLPFRHAAPDPELHMIVKGIGKALRSNLTSRANRLGPVLRRPLNKERVRVGRPAGSFRRPVVIKHLQSFPPPVRHECLPRSPDGTPTHPVPLGSN